MTEFDYTEEWVLSAIKADPTSDRIRWPEDFFSDEVVRSIVAARTRLHNKGAIAQAPSGYWYET